MADAPLTALSVADVARLLSAAGGNIDTEAVTEDVRSGAPVNDDGTLNLFHYTAWMAREATARGD